MQRKPYLLLLILIVLSFEAAAIEVGSVADSRFGDGWTLDGEEMTTTRAKLLEPANFGEGGTVPEAINITDVEGTIDRTTLSTFDVFFIGYLYDEDADAFTESELFGMTEWVSDGGTMVITCDETDYDAVCRTFGPVPSDANANEPVNPTVTGATRPPFDGPFGTPTVLEMDGTMKFFDDTAGFQVLAEDQDGNPVILEALIGDGRVVVMTDVDIISNHTLSEGTGIGNDNDRFLGNLFAYLASEAGETFFINPGLNGNWWFGPARSGEGAQLELIFVNNELLLVLNFYSYDDEGNQIFLIAVGPAIGNTANVNVFITEGGMWGANFDPADVNETPWGTGVVTASHCGAIHISLVPNGQNQAAGFTTLEHDYLRLATPAGPCPIHNPDIPPPVR